jgi:hypothetical protein
MVRGSCDSEDSYLVFWVMIPWGRQRQYVSELQNVPAHLPDCTVS